MSAVPAPAAPSSLSDLSALLPALAAASEQALTLPDARLSAFAPMQSWMALRHETQYSRLFRS